MTLSDKLNTLRHLLALNEPDALARLRPGLPREHVEQKLARLPFGVSTDAVELYCWADGSGEDPFELLPGAYFLGMDAAFDEFEQLLSMREELEEIFPQRYRNCFRFLSDFSDGGYAFGTVDPPVNGAIVHLCIHEEWLLAYQSLEKLIDTAIACRQRGVFGGGEIPDFELYFQIAGELNPEMQNWD